MKDNLFRKIIAGFSVIEMVIYMGMLSVLLAILTSIFITTLDTQLESETISNVQTDGRYILTRLIFDLQRAQSISLPANVGETANTLQLVIDGLNYTYSLVGGNLQIDKNNTLDVLNGFDTTISNLSFERLGEVGRKNSIKFTFTVTSKTQRPAGVETKNYQTTVALR